MWETVLIRLVAATTRGPASELLPAPPTHCSPFWWPSHRLGTRSVC